MSTPFTRAVIKDAFIRHPLWATCTCTNEYVTISLGNLTHLLFIKFRLFYLHISNPCLTPGIYPAGNHIYPCHSAVPHLPVFLLCVLFWMKRYVSQWTQLVLKPRRPLLLLVRSSEGTTCLEMCPLGMHDIFKERSEERLISQCNVRLMGSYLVTDLLAWKLSPKKKKFLLML